MLAANGIATAAPDYRLAPEASLTGIVHDTRQAICWLWRNAAELGIDRDNIVVTGSSAGGHLAATLAQPDWPQQYGPPVHPVQAVLPVSGLFELAPLAATHVQEWMQLSEKEIDSFSPLRHLPPPTIRIGAAVAEQELVGFHRQSAAWASATDTRLLTVSGRHHFDIILDYCDPQSALSQLLLSLVHRGSAPH